MAGERENFAAIRICNFGAGAVSGLQRTLLEEDLTSGKKTCPVEGSGIRVATEIDSRTIWDELVTRVRKAALENIDGWCEDPCSLCKAKAQGDSTGALLGINVVRSFAGPSDPDLEI